MNKRYALTCVSLLALLIISLVAQQSRQRRYYEYSRERYQLCLESLEGQQNGESLCSQITSAAEAAYSSENWGELLNSFISYIGFIILAGWIAGLDRQLRKTAEHTDV